MPSSPRVFAAASPGARCKIILPDANVSTALYNINVNSSAYLSKIILNPLNIFEMLSFRSLGLPGDTPEQDKSKNLPWPWGFPPRHVATGAWL